MSGFLPIGILGRSSGVTPPSGYVGEIIQSFVASGSAVSLTTNTAANVTSVSLTPGTWLVSLTVDFSAASTTVVRYLECSISATTAARDTTVGRVVRFPGTGAAGGVFDATGLGPTLIIPQYRLDLAATTTYFAVAYSTFGTSTLAAFGGLIATRVG